MASTNCPGCGSPVDMATDADTGEIVPLEVQSDPSSDAPRYRYVHPGPQKIVRRVADGAAGDFFPDHRFDCRDFNAGRTF